MRDATIPTSPSVQVAWKIDTFVQRVKAFARQPVLGSTIVDGC